MVGVCAGGEFPEMSGVSIVLRLPRKRKRMTTANPSRIRERSRWRGRGPSPPRPRSADAVEQPPVGAEGGLGRLDDRVLVGGIHPLGDQTPRLLRVGIIAALVHLEVLAARPAIDSANCARPSRVREIWAAALDRVEPRQRGQVTIRFGPGPNALGGLGSRLDTDLAAAAATKSSQSLIWACSSSA